MEFAVHYIIRFRGTLTQGPNAGKTYDWANSWAGVQFDSEPLARAKLATYQDREPSLEFRLLSRQWDGGRTGKYVETELAL
jgi:hypothetical protein